MPQFLSSGKIEKIMPSVSKKLSDRIIEMNYRAFVKKSELLVMSNSTNRRGNYYDSNSKGKIKQIY